MSTLATIWSFFAGKKTYIIAALMILTGYLKGDQNLIWEGFGFAGLRNALP